jgi:hypothetical protein
MNHRRTAILVCALIVSAVILTACGEKETPEQRTERLRYNHEIFPVAVNTLYDADGNPTLLVDLQVANQGSDALSQLTVLVTILGADGQTKDSRRVTLDMEGVRPGIGARVSASLPGVELLEEDEVTVAIETGLTPDELRALPEFAEASAVN